MQGGNTMKKRIALGLAALSLWTVTPEAVFAKPKPAHTTQMEQDASRARGRALRPGDCIGIVAPASTWDKADFDAAVAALRRMGYRLKIAPSCKKEFGYFSGTDEERAADLNRFFADDEVDAILCVRGGYGSARILDKLDYKKIARHPKQFIGFSDITALHIALGDKSGLATVHGPVLLSFADGVNRADYTDGNFFKGLSGRLYPGEIPMPAGKRLQTLYPGEAKGVIVGGNLSLIASLVGTPYELKGDGALLFIEEIGAYTYQIDRLLRQLWQSGLLQRVDGILIGNISGADDDYEEGDFRLEDILKQYAQLVRKPMIVGVPAGHAGDNLYLPFGVRAVMKADKDGTASLRIEESPVLPAR